MVETHRQDLAPASFLFPALCVRDHAPSGGPLGEVLVYLLLQPGETTAHNLHHLCEEPVVREAGSVRRQNTDRCNVFTSLKIDDEIKLI